MFIIKHVYNLKLNSKVFPPKYFPLFIWLSSTCEFQELVKNMSTKGHSHKETSMILYCMCWVLVVHMTFYTFKREVQ